MNPESYFFLIFLVTIIIIRTFLYFRPTSGPTIKGIRTHHYMYGIILALIGLILKNLTLYAIGLGLFIDEFMFIIIKGKNHKDNYSAISLIGTLIFIVIVFLLRKHIFNI